MNKIKQYMEKHRIGYDLKSQATRFKLKNYFSWQRDPDLYQPILDYGCFFLSAIGAALIHFNRKPTADFFNYLYLEGVRKGWIGKKCYVKNLWALLNSINLNLIEYKMTVGKETLEGDYLNLIKYKHGKYGHFVIGDGKGNCILDPLGDVSQVRQKGRIESQRFFKVVEK